MALTLYRAHTANERGDSTCKNKRDPKDEGHQACNCPIRAKGRLNGVRIRKACQTVVWGEAEALVARAEQTGHWIEPEEGVQSAPATESTDEPKLTQVVDEYCQWKLSPKASPRQLGPTSIFHVYSLLGHPDNRPAKPKEHPRTATTLKSYCQSIGIEFNSQLTAPLLRRWIDKWDCGRKPLASRIGRVKEYFKFCVDRGYITTNPATALDKPILTKKDDKQRLPFKDEEVEKLFDCVGALRRKANGVIVGNDEIEAVMLVTLEAGPALSDATNLNEAALVIRPDGSADWSYTRIKNNVKIDTALPAHVVKRLLALQRYPGGYFFYHGGDSTISRTTFWQHVMNEVFEMAQMPKGASGTHRFRHTYAHRFLRSEKKQGGMYELSKLLGHETVATTEKYYAAYVPELAERCRSAARSVWAHAA